MTKTSAFRWAQASLRALDLVRSLQDYNIADDYVVTLVDQKALTALEAVLQDCGYALPAERPEFVLRKVGGRQEVS